MDRSAASSASSSSRSPVVKPPSTSASSTCCEMSFPAWWLLASASTLWMANVASAPKVGLPSVARRVSPSHYAAPSVTLSMIVATTEDYGLSWKHRICRVVGPLLSVH